MYTVNDIIKIQKEYMNGGIMMRNKNMIISFVAIVIVSIIGSAIFLSNKEESTNNIFQYAINVKENEFYPARLEFFMTKDQVQKTLKGKLDYVDDPFLGKHIDREFELEGLSTRVKERCILEETKRGEIILVSISYYITVEKNEKADFCEKLYEQAKSFAPELLMTVPESLEAIKTCPEQLNIAWQDSNDCYVYFSVPATPDIDGDVFILQIASPRELAGQHLR